MQWAKFNLEKKTHDVSVNVSENFALLSRDKIGIKEDLITQHDVEKNVDSEQLHSENHTNSTNLDRDLS